MNFVTIVLTRLGYSVREKNITIVKESHFRTTKIESSSIHNILRKMVSFL